MAPRGKRKRKTRVPFRARRDGEVVRVPAMADVLGIVWDRDDPRHVTLCVLVDGSEVAVRIQTTLFVKVLSGTNKCPTKRTLVRWRQEGFAKTPTGAWAPVDGWAEDGSPSWAVVLGDAS